MLGLGKSMPRHTNTVTDMVDTVAEAERLVVVRTNANREIEQVAGNVEALTGHAPKGKLVGQRLSEVVRDLKLTQPDGTPLLDDPEINAALGEALNSRKPRRLNAMTVTEDGRSVSITSLLPGDGTVLTTLRDVSKITDERLMLDTAVRAAKAGYWSMDLQTGQYDYSSSVTSRLSDAERNIMQRNGLFAIVHKDDLGRIASQWQDILSGVAPFDLTYRVETEADGLMWQRSIGQLQRRPDGKLTRAVAFVMDITEDRKNLADLEEAQGMARAKEDFMARMSHEIRTPLNAIIGMADSLRDEAMSPAVRDVVRDMEDAAENLNELLSRTLDHARLENSEVEAHFEEADPRDTLRACAAMWRAKAEGKGLAFRLAVAGDVPERMPLDAFRLRQCLNNLIGNAIKFTAQGGITLAARAVERNGAPHLAVIVQDTGIGMSADEQRTVFDPYQQADGSINRQYGGTGLGLSICRQLAAVMDGEIVLRSEPGKGSAFLLFLPVAPGASATGTAPLISSAIPQVMPAEREGQPAQPDARMPFEGLSVLCVEDNPVNQKVVERLIGGRVQQLHFASHGREALSILNTVHVDVVLMDIHMPVMDGIETTMEIRNSGAPYANVIIIALTADPDYQQMRICKNIGMDDSIAKPVRRDDILQAFNRSLSRLNEAFGVKIAL